MLIDSHCHLNMLDLTNFNNDLANVLTEATNNGVQHFLSVSVTLEDYPILQQLALTYPNVSISVGLHPNEETLKEPTIDELIKLGSHKYCLAIGETGLDFYRTTIAAQQDSQKQRFINHIEAAKILDKPLIIHTRSAATETIEVMKQNKAHKGVMHCFTENWDIAKQALDLGFYISISGIVTFKNATTIQEVAKKVPLDRLLIETDSPFLAPVPYRGQQNHPALIKHVALSICQLRQIPYEDLANATTDNFYRCFKLSATSAN